MKTRPLPLLGALALVSTLSGITPRLAHAQSSAAAEALFEQGRKEMTAGNYDAACAKLRESDRLDPAPGTKYNLADCEEHRGKYATAWALFKTLEGQLSMSDERHPIVVKRREAVESKVPTLKIVLAPGAPDGTTVKVGELSFARASFGVPIPLDPGQHELTVSAPGHAERRLVATLTEGAVEEVSVAPGDALPESAAPSAAAPTTVATATPRDTGAETSGSSPVLGYVIGGVGVAGIGLGAATGFLALDKANTASEHCDGPPLEVCDQVGVDANASGKPLAWVSTIGFIAGAVGVGVGAYLILTSGDDGEPQTAVVTRGDPTGASVSLVHRW